MLSALPSAGQSSDSTWVNLRPYPLALWSPRVGFGVGAGLVVHNAIRPGSQILLTAAPAQHESVATLSFASADPLGADRYLLVDARAETTDRLWYHGVGPRSRDETRLTLSRTAWQVRLRAGQRLGEAPVRVQPHVALQSFRADTFGGLRDVPRGFSAASRRALEPFLALPPPEEPPPLGPTRTGDRQRGLRYGVDLIVDTRDRPAAPTRGLRATVSAFRYDDLRQDALQFDRLDVRVNGLVPLGGRHRLDLGVRVAATHDRGAAPIPFYLLPSFDTRTVPGWDRGRFAGSDLVSARALYRFPLARVRDLATLEGHVGAHLASVYDDLGDEFTLDVSLDETLAPGAGAPLRPSASVGVRVGLPVRAWTVVEFAVGVSPEGVTGARVSFTPSLRTLRPAHHRPAP